MVNGVRTLQEHTEFKTGTKVMLALAIRVVCAQPGKLLREAVGLVALAGVIVAGLLLPALA
jgi:hypothetical protein